MPTKDEHFGNGLGLYGKHEYEGALVELGKAVELDPQFADAHLAIGHALHKLERLPEAVDAIKKAIAANPQEPLYHTSLSTVFRDMGMIREAEEEMAVSFQLQRGY
jgi:tetratricopeptide (TPR) repeat protein